MQACGYSHGFVYPARDFAPPFLTDEPESLNPADGMLNCNPDGRYPGVDLFLKFAQGVPTPSLERLQQDNPLRAVALVAGVFDHPDILCG